MRGIKILLALAMIFCLTLHFSTVPVSAADVQKQDKVLFISSYSLSYPTVSKQISGIKEGLDDDIYLYYEFMDGKTISDDAYVAQFYKYINYKYSHLGKLDAVIVGDDDALQMVLKYRYGFFKDVPIIYESINSRARANLADQLGLAGVLEEDTIKPNLDLAVKIYPKAKKIVAITDDSKTGQAWAAYLKAIRSSYEPVDVELLDTSVLSRKAIVRKIAALKTNDILLYMTFSKDADGKTYTYKEASNLVVKNARVPVFTLFWIGNGTLGGIAPNSTDSGKVAGEMASDVIDGKPMSEVKSRSADKGVATFDAKVMKKYGVKRSRLPSGATLVHDDTSYTRLIIIILALVIMMIVLAALMIKLRKDNRIKEEQENQLRRISDRLKTEAEIDTLTKLGNRRLFDRELESSANSTRQFELFLVDIDDFKGINDKYGHQVGDEILAEVGARLNRIKCRQLMPYRYGGDEFTITYFSSDEDKKEIGLEILKLFDEPIVTRTGELEIHISVGSAIYPEDADTPDGLFHCADKALYTVKNKGKGGFEKYSNAKRGK